MGQYWFPVNLTKREYVNPHKLGTGLKLWEQLANMPGTPAALLILLAAMPEARGGGDFDLDSNWHGPERTIPPYGASPGPMPQDYPSVAKRTIGRWAGDYVLLVGDYSEDADKPEAPVPLSQVYDLCHEGDAGFLHDTKYGPPFKDISEDVCRVIEHELGGRFEGTGWRHWKENSAT